MPHKQYAISTSLVFCVLIVALGLAGCSGKSISPTATAVPAEPTVTLPQPAATKSPPTAAATVTAEINTPDRAMPLANLLRYVPDASEYRRYLAFGDYDAWLQSWEIERPANFDDVQQMNERDRGLWIGALGRQTSPPDALVKYIGAEAMADRYGFDFFGSHQYLTAGEPPDLLTVMTQSRDANDIAQALTAIGYQSRPFDDTAVLYSVREDYEVDFESEIKTGKRGELNRIAISGDTLVIAWATAVAEDAIDSADGRLTSLAGDPAYQALLRSLDAPELDDAGVLVGAILLGETVPANINMAGFVSDGKSSEEITVGAEQVLFPDPPLPGYAVAGLLTYRAPDATYLALHTVFPNSESAVVGMEVLVDRLQNYVSATTESPVPWSLDRAFVVEETAVILMRPDETNEQFGSLSWLEMVLMRDLNFLVTG